MLRERQAQRTGRDHQIIAHEHGTGRLQGACSIFRTVCWLGPETSVVSQPIRGHQAEGGLLGGLATSHQFVCVDLQLEIAAGFAADEYSRELPTFAALTAGRERAAA